MHRLERLLHSSHRKQDGFILMMYGARKWILLLLQERILVRQRIFRLCPKQTIIL